jgi:hypothetical protein
LFGLLVGMKGGHSFSCQKWHRTVILLLGMLGSTFSKVWSSRVGNV